MEPRSYPNRLLLPTRVLGPPPVGLVSRFRWGPIATRRPATGFDRSTSSTVTGLRQAPHLHASGTQLSIRNYPSKDRLNRDQAWIFRLAHDREQLEPELVVGALHKLANGAGDEIRRDHGRR